MNPSGSLAFLLFSYPLVCLTNQGTLAAIITAQFLFGVLIAFYEGPLVATILSLVPVNVRYSSTTFGFNLGFAIFGGLGPLIAASLMKATLSLPFTSCYLIICAFVSLIAVLSARPLINSKNLHT